MRETTLKGILVAPEKKKGDQKERWQRHIAECRENVLEQKCQIFYFKFSHAVK